LTDRIATAGVRGRIRHAMIEQKFLAVLLILFVAKGVLITYVHEPFSGHDEVMHYAYLQYVAEDQRIPVIPDLGEWQADDERGIEDNYDRAPDYLWPYCQFVTQDWNIDCKQHENPTWKANLGGEFLPMGWVYTANHPPLYYLYMTPFYWLTDSLSIETQLTVFRLATLPFGLLTVLFAYLTARTLVPRDRFLAMTVPAFVAFQPQISYEAAMLNNDAAAIAFTSAVVYLLVRGLKSGFPIGTVALTGFCFGLAALSKNTSLTAGLTIAVAMILGLGLRNWRAWVPRGAIAGGVAALMVAPWFLYMYSTYGDLTALGRVSDLQWWNYSGGTTPTIWSQLTDQDFLWLRWRETWGEFGWRLIWLGTIGNWPLLRALMWVAMIGAAGVAVWAIRFYRASRRVGDDAGVAPATESVFLLERWQVVGVLTMGVTCITTYYAILQFGVTFSLTQARYYFTAIVPAAILLMLGYRALIPRRWLPYGRLVIFVSLVILNVVIYSAWVLPYWASAFTFYPNIDPFYR
jgi:4-amino-4-deoxy-L-arabinose transferase-like glycosyltransferase